MKNILIAFFLLVSANLSAQTKVTAPIERNNGADTYATHSDTLGNGGFMVFANTITRDLLPSGQRKVGMMVAVGNVLYQLQGGILNANWVRKEMLDSIKSNYNNTRILSYKNGVVDSTANIANRFGLEDTVINSYRVVNNNAGLEILGNENGTVTLLTEDSIGYSYMDIYKNEVTITSATKPAISEFDSYWLSVHKSSGIKFKHNYHYSDSDHTVRTSVPFRPINDTMTDQTLAVSVKANGTLYHADTTGVVDLGTIAGSGGGGISQFVSGYGMVNINDSTARVDTVDVVNKTFLTAWNNIYKSKWTDTTGGIIYRGIGGIGINAPPDLYGVFKLNVNGPIIADYYTTNTGVTISNTGIYNALGMAMQYYNGSVVKNAIEWDNTGGAFMMNGALGIGTTTPTASSLIDVTSTTKGILAPRMNTTQMNAILAPANGLIITNTDSLNRLFIFTGAGWKGLSFTSEHLSAASVATQISDSLATLETGLGAGLLLVKKAVSGALVDSVNLDFPKTDSSARKGLSLAFTTTGSGAATGSYNNITGAFAVNIPTPSAGGSVGNADSLGNKPASYYAVDSTVLHKGSTETVWGTKTFLTNLTANSFIKSGGTSSQFLKADGSIDVSTYLTTTGSAASLTSFPTLNQSTTGNAGTVTNGVYTTGSYTNPSWLVSLPWSKITATPTLMSGYGITTNVKDTISKMITDSLNNLNIVTANSFRVRGSNSDSLLQGDGSRISKSTFDFDTSAMHKGGTETVYGYKTWDLPILFNTTTYNGRVLQLASTRFLSHNVAKGSTFLGYASGNTHGDAGTYPENVGNTAVGHFALYSANKSFATTAVGTQALLQYTGRSEKTDVGINGSDMTFMGYNAGNGILGGYASVGIGNEAFYNRTAVNSSVAIGNAAGMSLSVTNDSMTRLIAIGTRAGYNSRLDSSILIGSDAGISGQTNGGKLILIGDLTARTSAGVLNNTTIIGHNVVTNLDNVVALGSNQNIIIGSDATWTDWGGVARPNYTVNTGDKLQVNGSSISTAWKVAGSSNLYYLRGDGSTALISSLGSGSPTWASITGTPTTMAGYGITNNVKDTISKMITDSLNAQEATLGIGLTLVKKSVSLAPTDSIKVNLPQTDSSARKGLSLAFTTTGTSGPSTFTYNQTTGAFVANIPDYAGSGGVDILPLNNIFTGSNTFAPAINSTIFKGTSSTDGGIVGSEILTTANWTSVGWTGDFTNGFSHTDGNTTILSNTQAAAFGSSYLIVATVTLRTAGSFIIAFGGVTLPSISATSTFAFLASSAANFTVTPTSDFNGKITFSLKNVSSNVANIIYRSSTDVSQNEIRFGSSGTSIYQGIGAGRRTLAASGNNSIFGHQAFIYNVNGTNNTVVGAYSLGNSSRSSQITAVGQSSLGAYLAGDQMTAVGALSLYNQISGSGVTAFGYNSGRRIADNVTASTIQDNSLFVGHDSRPLANNQTNQNVVGFNTIGNGSNTSTWGNTSTIGHYFSGQQFWGGYGTGSTYTGTPIGNLQVNAAGAIIVGAVGGGSGDMVLASTQTNTGAKTFLNGTLLLRNVANTFNGVFTNTNTADRTYTLKDASGTVAFVSDITGTNSGTNTGDNSINTLYSGLVSNATHTGDATGSTALTVVRINGTQLSGLATGILKNTTGTGVPSIAIAGDFPTLNQNTTGSAATLTTSRNINGVAFNGSADITVTAAAGTLTGATLNSGVTASSLTSHGTITSGGLGTGAVIGGVTMTLGSDASNDMYYRNASGILTRLANGTTGQFIGANTGAAPTWQTPAGGGGAANLALGIATTTTQPVTNSNGTGFTLPTFGTNAGLVPGSATASAQKHLTEAGTWVFDGVELTYDPSNNTTVSTVNGTPSDGVVVGGWNAEYAATQTITSGSSSTVTSPRVWFNPASVISTYTLTMPQQPSVGDKVRIYAGKTIAANGAVVTTFTVSPNTLTNAQTIYGGATITTLNGGDYVEYEYMGDAGFTWYRK